MPGYGYGYGYGIDRTSSMAGYAYLLDNYSGAAAAYSLRKLNSDYSGSAIRVRESSGNTEADIGFVGGELDTTSLLAHCGANDGYVVTWFDQSDTRDATQSTAANQPQIVNSGTVINDNSLPALQFDGSNDYLVTAAASAITDGDSLVTIVSHTTAADYIGGVFQEKQISTSFNRNEIWGTTSISNLRAAVITPQASGDLTLFYGSAQAAKQCLITLQVVGTTYTIYRDGVEIDSGTKADNFSANTELFIGVMRNLYHTGYIQECIVWDSDQSANRTAIESNINTHYAIYPDEAIGGLLYEYAGASAAYSLRQLTIYKNGYKAPLVRVRRSSDNAEADVYADSNYQLSLTSNTSTGQTLTDWISSDDGYVVTWFDQSGNNDATQATAGSQPQIVSSGSIITDSGYQVIQYDGSDDNLGTSLTATGTMLMGGSDGTAFYEVAISGAYDLLGTANNTDHPLKESIRVIWGRTLSASEQSEIELRVTYSDWDFSDVTSYGSYWRQRNELTSFPLIDTSNGVTFVSAWFNCNSLTSFPLLDVSNASNFAFAWLGCNSLTSFPLLDVSSGTNFSYSWQNCSSLTSFPLLDTSSGTTFNNAWINCSSLTSFPLLDVSSSTNFENAWRGCISLTSFPANMFDSVTATNFTLAFDNTNLTQTSIDNILVSLDTAGQSGGTFNQSGGSAPSATGEAAIDNLRSRGWTVTVTGGY